LGYNAHHAPIESPFGPYVSGGSSAGSGSAVGRRQVPVAIGTDTGGSVRIPACFCGITGYKPTVGTVPNTGCHPLCDSLDSIGALAWGVDDCALIHRVMAGSEAHVAAATVEAPNAQQLRLLVPLPIAYEKLEEPVAAAFRGALDALRAAGVRIEEKEVPLSSSFLDAVGKVFSAEGAVSNAALLADPEQVKSLDSLSRQRLERGNTILAPDYLQAKRTLQSMAIEVDRITSGFDAMITPTVPILPPEFRAIEASEEDRVTATNRVPTFTRLINGLGRCAMTVPCHPASATLPVGLHVACEANADERCFRVSKAVETVLRAAGLGPPPPSCRESITEPSLKKQRT